jgi:uncharacterized lipoprotein YddW (UPF0748 family)
VTAGQWRLDVTSRGPLPTLLVSSLRPLLCTLVVAALSACGGTADVPDVEDAGSDGGSASSRDGGAGGAPDGGTGGALVAVGHPRELRGAWVSTVSNLDWPPSSSLGPDAGRASLEALVDDLEDAGMNALFFQVRPESDALYASSLEPWSRFLSGTQGRDPGWDPLEEILALAHARGMEVHAWMNPYRGLTSASVQAAPNHVTRTLASAAVTYDGKVVMDPGVPAVRAHVKAVVEDVLSRYDVDGLHFDDYFYPYPTGAGTPFPDAATYSAYQADGGTLSKADWRRDNVNALVREVMELVQAGHPHVRFGISPFGIWKSGTPAGITGLSAYDAISCDAVTWMQQGWVDYLAPQLYWPTAQACSSCPAQDFLKLSTWWAGGTVGGRHLFTGLATYRLGTTAAWTLSEYRAQMEHLRTLRASGGLGAIHFRAANFRTNLLGVRDLVRGNFYERPALLPPVPRDGAAVPPPPPLVTRQDGSLVVFNPQPLLVRFHALYRERAPGDWELMEVKGGPQCTFTVEPGTWAVSAVGRGGGESQGTRISVP